jgi:hypothetical protein
MVKDWPVIVLTSISLFNLVSFTVLVGTPEGWTVSSTW